MKKILIVGIIIAIVLYFLLSGFHADPYLGPPIFDEVKAEWEVKEPLGITSCYPENDKIFLEIINNSSDSYPEKTVIVDKVIVNQNEYLVEGASNSGGTIGLELSKGKKARVEIYDCATKYKRIEVNSVTFEYRYWSEHFIPTEQTQTHPQFFCYCS